MTSAKQIAARKLFPQRARAGTFRRPPYALRHRKHPSDKRRKNPEATMAKRFKQRELSVPEKHQLKIARQTLTYSDAGARVMGGPTKAESREIIFRLTGKRPIENPRKRKKNPEWPTKIPGEQNSEQARKMEGYFREQQKQLASFMRAGKVKRKRKKNPSGVRIVYNKLLGGWFIVRGPHQTPLGGRFNSKAEAEAHLRRKNPIKGPGKFEGETYAGKYAYENFDEDLGAVQDFGWYGNFSGKIKGRGPFHIIVREDSQGFVYGEFFDTEAKMRKAWSQLERGYEKFSEESEGEGYG